MTALFTHSSTIRRGGVTEPVINARMRMMSFKVARWKSGARGVGLLFCSGILLSWAASGAELLPPLETAFDRILPGWTNYSTAFNATHDLGAAGDYASVAAFYTPVTDVQLGEFSVIVIGGSTRAPDFAQFQFRVLVWSGLEALIREPRVGDVAIWDFVAPTGGSVVVP